MSRKPNPKRDDPGQSERFIKAALEAEANETKEGAEAAFDKVIRPPQKKPERKP